MNEAPPRSMNSIDAILENKVLMMTHLDFQKRFPIYHVCPECLAALPCGSAFQKKLHNFHPDTSTRSKIVNSRTHPTTLVRSSGFQVFVGYGNHRAQSPSRCSNVLPPSRLSSANNVLAQEPSLHPSSGRRARRRDRGKAQDSTFSSPSSCPRESPTQFSIRSNHWKTSKRCFGTK